MPTPEPKIIYQLVTEQDIGEAPTSIVLGDSTDVNSPLYCDWDLDGNGLIRTVSKQDAMLQTLLKCIFTELQDSGYGSGIYDFIGVKDVSARRASVFMNLSISVLRLKKALSAIAQSQNLAASDQILTIQSISVSEDSDNNQRLNVSLSIKSADNTITEVGVL